MTDFLRWNSEFKAADIIALLGFIATVVVVIYAGLQIRQSTRATRTDTVLRLLDNYFGDEKLQSMYYKIDYKDYDHDMPFPTRKDEPYVDRLIYFFDTVGWLIRSGILTMDEVGLIAYQAQRVLRNSDVQAYLHRLDGAHKSDGRPTPAHRDARNLAQAIARERRLRS